MSQSPLTFEEIETEVQQFETAERKRLGLEPDPAPHWHDRNPQQFERAQRKETTILAGGLTIAQDAASSVVYGMPRVAHESGAATYQIPLSEIPNFIVSAL